MTAPTNPRDALDYRSAAAAIPGRFLAKADFLGAADALSQLLSASAGGFIPISSKNARPDAHASLWFIRAAQLFAKGGGDAELVVKLRESCTRILQQFIFEKGVGGVTMDHGGLLTNKSPADLVRLNALWYSALETMADDLKNSGDRTGDHFERLTGRFRRTFAKAYWCEGHGCICPSHLRTEGSHGQLPDPDQLLLTVLPASPMPKTKQRQVVIAIRERAVPAGSVGVIMDHPTMGRVESVVHRAWLAIGLINSADNRNTVLADARAILEPLKSIISAENGLAEFYRDGKPLGHSNVAVFAETTSALELAGS